MTSPIIEDDDHLWKEPEPEIEPYVDLVNPDSAIEDLKKGNIPPIVVGVKVTF